MASTDTFDLGRLALSFGEARSLEVPVRLHGIRLGGQAYEPRARSAPRLDVSRTAGGYALRLRCAVAITGPCVRCLEPAEASVEIDAREVDQPGAGDEELRSPYVSGDQVEIGRWAADALALAMPQRLLCRPECAGLCPVCGESLNDSASGGHDHDPGDDPRWAKLRELKLE